MISTDDIYKPLQEFILKKINQANHDDILFCFDGSGMLGYEIDISQRLEQGNFSDPMTREKFSDYVNHIPTFDKDDPYYSYTSAFDLIDQEYLSIITQADAFYENDQPDDEREKILNDFTKVRNEANKKYTNGQYARTGIADLYRPAIPTPDQFANLWKKYSYTVSGKGTQSDTTTQPSRNRTGLWQLKLDNIKFNNLVTQLQTPDTRLNIMGNKREFKAISNILLNPKIKTLMEDKNNNNNIIEDKPIRAIPMPINRIPDIKIKEPAVDNKLIINNQIKDKPNTVKIINTVPLKQINTDPVYFNRNLFINNTKAAAIYTDMKIQDKILLHNFINQNAETKPATTLNINVSFEYTFIDIERPWLSWPFITDTHWHIRDKEAHEINSTFPAIPMTIILVRNVALSGNWTQEDIENAKNAMAFGPFELDDNNMINSTLSNPHIQVLGWIFKKLPPLPPNPTQKTEDNSTILSDNTPTDNIPVDNAPDAPNTAEPGSDNSNPNIN